MTSEELKPFIGKKVRVVRMCGDVEVGVLSQRITNAGYVCYTVLPNYNFEFYGHEIAKIELLESEQSPKKPPLGLKPKFVWIDQRIEEIKAAVNRCFDDNYPVRTEWIEEYNELIKSEKAER